jgi:hypothetical protein
MRTTFLGFLGASLALTACGGGGGGGDRTPPTIVAAAFVGNAATPASGDLLLLTLSESVTLAAGKLIDDADLELSAGSLGAVTVAPAAHSARVVAVTLGPGVDFAPDAATIRFRAGNDAVLDANGNRATAGSPVVVKRGDADAPQITSLTLNGIDGVLSGTGSAGGTLQTPRTGIRIDVGFSDATGVDGSRAVVTASTPVSVSGASRSAGATLTDALVATTTPTSASFAVPAAVLFTPGPLTLTVWVIDQTDRPSAPATFSFQTVDTSNGIRPFETTQVWFLDLSRDVESFTAQSNGTEVTEVTIVGGANGRSDLEDLFLITGLLAPVPLPNVSSGMDSNQFVLELFRSRILAELAGAFDGVRISFTFTSPGTFPQGQSSVPYANATFSRICIAGAARSTPVITLGAALFDPNNATQNDNCLTDFNGVRLGVFLHAAVREGYLAGASGTFHMTYGQFTPSLNGGVPIGGNAQDGARLTGANTDGRATAIHAAINRMGRLAAIVVAHECGHSMGLVANGAMPAGLYGGLPQFFPLGPGQPAANANGHIQNTSLFPQGAQNIMSPAIDFDTAQASGTKFNSLNLAYLREQALYNEQ